MSKPLDELLEIDPAFAAPTSTSLTPAPAPVETALVSTTDSATLDTAVHADVDYARTNIVGAVDKVKHALDSAILLAQSGDSPRAFEVVGSMLTAIVNANKELVGLHKTRQDTLSVQHARTQHVAGATGGSNVTIEKAVFVGKASDLLRELKAMKQQVESASDVEVIEVSAEGDADAS